MRQAAIVAALLCVLAVNVTSKPNEVPAKKQQSSNPQGPSSLTVYDENKSTYNADQSDNNPPKWYAPVERPDWWLVLIAGLTGFLIYLQAREMTRATKEMQASTEVARKTLVLTQRPRIITRVFYFSEVKSFPYPSPNGMQAGSFCSGQFYIQNCGGTDARVREIYCMTFIADALPMKRPYEGKEGSKEEKTLRPGQSSPYLFGCGEPLDAQMVTDIIKYKTKSFYVLGWIGYTDDFGIYRITGFCRRYDGAKNRFLPVADPDYEYAD
jgi:hypothetical protein